MDDESRIIKPNTARVMPMQDEGKILFHGKRKKKRRPDARGVTLSGVTNYSYIDSPHYEQQRDSTAIERSGRGSVGNMSTGTYIIDSENQDVGDGFKLRRLKKINHTESMNRTSNTLKKLKIDSRVSMYHSKKNLDKNLVANYVRKIFKARVCNEYVQDSDPKQINMCKCGRDIEWHVRNAVVVNLHNSEQPWYPETNTKQVPCTSFGEISFMGFGRESCVTAPYIRIDAFETRYDDVLRLMTDYWNVPPPKLIIGITGGAKQFHWKKRLLDTFKTGIINAAKTTSAWLISGGMDEGVMKNVGQAVEDHMLSHGADQSNIVALGVATWGYIGNRQALEGEAEGGMFPALYNAEDLHGPCDTPLNPGHTHFILVDDGTNGQYGREIDFWTGFQHYISQKMETKIMQGETVRVPVVLMVLEGGPNTLKTAAASIKNDTPVVVIQGSGRCADFIATGYRLSKPKPGSEESNFSAAFDDTMSAVAAQMLSSGQVKPNETKKYVQSLRAILADRKYITIFSLDDETSTNDIDKAILNALLQANQSSAHTQLSLAVAWNRCDIAREQIFTAENRNQWQHLRLSDALFTALVQNRVDFVQLFLDMGVNLKKFLTVKRLRDLYEKVLEDKFAGNSRDLLKNLLSTLHVGLRYYLCCGDISDDMHTDRKRLLSCVGILISMLLGYQVPNMYAGSEYEVNESDHVKPMDETYSFLTARRTFQEADFNKIAGGKLMQRNNLVVSCSPERDLLFWSILLNRRELALLFWRLGQDHVGGALMCSSLLKALSAQAEDAEEVDLASDLSKHSDEFESLANGVLTELYCKNKGLTHLSLIRNMEHWGNVTCMTIADTGEHMDFIGHSACQTRLNKIWRGRMALYTSNLKIVMTLFLPFVVWWIKFSTKDSSAYELVDDDENVDQKDVKITTKEREEDLEEELEDQAALGAQGRDQGRRNLYSVSLLGRGKNSISLFNAIIYFYTAPVTKFLLTSFFYLVFLSLFSYFVLTDLYPLGTSNSPSVIEFITWIWITTLIVEEWRQLAVRDHRSFRYKFRSWYSDYWNRFDFILYLLFIAAVITRCTLDGKNFYIARAFYAVTVGMCFLRFMQVFYAHRDIGPKVIMIRRMITDVFFFLCILSVFIAAYGISSQALLYPNAEGGGSLFKSIFRTPYWQMYGELFLERVEGDLTGLVCSYNESVWKNSDNIEQCPVQSELTPLLFAVYMILTNVLLLNLLIAMFSYTFQNVQENSDLVWRFYRHDLVYEYFDRPPLVAPLIIFSHLYLLARYLLDKCRQRSAVYNTAFCVYLGKDHNMQVTAFERAGMEQYLVKFKQEDRDNINTKVSNTAAKIEKVIMDLEVIKESMSDNKSSGEVEKPVSPTLLRTLNNERMESREDNQKVDVRLAGLENQISKIMELLTDPSRLCRCQQEPPHEHGDGREYERSEDRLSVRSPRRRSGRQRLVERSQPRTRSQAHSQIPMPTNVAHSYPISRTEREVPPPLPREGGYIHSMFEEPNVNITDIDSS